MKQRNFQSENLVVDYISFNIKGSIDSKTIAKISTYLYQSFGFNSIIAKKFNYKWKSKYLNYDHKNRFNVSFRHHEYHPESKSFWVGTKINFSGNNAAQIYKIIKAQKFDWSIFEPYTLKLSRFDLCYFRKTKPNDKEETLKLFFNKCYQKICAKSKRNIAEYKQNSQGSILRIGNRKSPNYSRIYQRSNGLRFELEMKKRVPQDLLFSNCIREFEHKLTIHFYSHSKKILVFHDCYTDWLIDYFRKEDKPINSLVSTYFKKKDFDSVDIQKDVFRLLQFLSFSRRYPAHKVYVVSQRCYLIQFPVQEFMDFMNIKNRNQYQLERVKDFLRNLRNHSSALEVFSDQTFQNIGTIVFVGIKKEHKSLVGQVLMVDELYFYRYPFSFPSFFLTYQNTYELQVKLQIIKVMCINSLEKKFYVKTFLDQFNISTQKRAQIKKLIVKSFEKLHQANLIENQFKLLTKNTTIKKCDKLTSLIIGRSEIIYFSEKL